jgi:hypothetical protein
MVDTKYNNDAYHLTCGCSRQRGQLRASITVFHPCTSTPQHERRNALTSDNAMCTVAFLRWEATRAQELVPELTPEELAVACMAF